MEPADYFKAHNIRDKLYHLTRALATHQPHNPADLLGASQRAVERDALHHTTGSSRRLPHEKATRAGSAVRAQAVDAGGGAVPRLAELEHRAASLASLRIAADPDGFFAQADQDGLCPDAWDRACAGVLGDVEPELMRRLFDQLDYAKRGRVSKGAFLAMRAAIRLFLEGAQVQDLLVELLAGLVAAALSKMVHPREDAAGDACTEQTLDALAELSEEEMRPALSTLALSLKEHGVQRKREREERARKLASLTAVSCDHREGKFAHLPTAAYGDKDSFHKGLDIIGLPHPHVLPEMAREFLEGPDAQDEFTAWNSGENRTFSRKEWWFVVEPFVMSSVSAHRPPEEWELKFEFGGNRAPVRLEVFLHVLSASRSASARGAGPSGRVRFGDYKLAATLDREDPRWLHENEVDMVQVVLCRYIKSQLDAISLTNALALETTPRLSPPPHAQAAAAAKAHKIVSALEQGLRDGGDGAACTCTFASLVAAVVREGAATEQELEAIMAHFHTRFAGMPISEPEVIASRLYTGPPFVKMNGPLREASGAFPKEWTEHLKGNKYTNTVYACNSMLIKFSQISRIPPRRVVYRGISGVKLPAKFLVVAEGGGRGGVDFGFLSTSTSKEVAVAYLGDKEVPVLFQIEVGDIDRGAALSFLSQYPMEDEILFPPLSYMEVVGEPFHLETDKGMVSCYPCRINCNLKGRTIEEIDAHRQKEVTSLIPYLGNELWRDLPPVVAALAAQLEANGIEGLAEAQEKLQALRKEIERDFDALRADMQQPEKMHWLNQDTHYKEAMVTLIEFKHQHMTRLVKAFSASENTHQNMTGLIVAAKEGWTKVVEALLAARAPVDARDAERWTCLHYASRHGHTAVVQVLLQGAADIEARNKWERTSLHLAALYGHSAVVRTLLQHGADLEARNKSNLSALDFALQVSLSLSLALSLSSLSSLSLSLSPISLSFSPLSRALPHYPHALTLVLFSRLSEEGDGSGESARGALDAGGSRRRRRRAGCGAHWQGR